MLRGLVWLADADQVLQLTGQGFLVLSGFVALDERVDGALDEYLGEPADLTARFVASLFVRTLDRRLQDDTAPARNQAAEPGELARLKVPLVLVLSVANVQELCSLATVEDLDVFPESSQAVGEGGRERGLARPAHPGEPHREPRGIGAVHGVSLSGAEPRSRAHITG